METVGSWVKEWGSKKGIVIDYRPETTSTNDLAKDDPSPYFGIRVHVTDHQSQGRGRNNNSWSDLPGCLLSSWSFHLEQSPQPIASPLIGLALFRSLQATWPTLHWSIKAPNDIYLDDKKVAGVLLETVSIGKNHRFIIGLGLNINSHPELEISTCISQHLGRNLDKNDLAQFLDKFWIEVARVLAFVIRPTLADVERADILAALNRFPKLENHYTEVTSSGSLATGNQTVAWQQL